MSGDLKHFERVAEQRYRRRAAEAPLLAVAGLVPRDDPATLAARKDALHQRNEARLQVKRAERAAQLAAWHAELGDEAAAVWAFGWRITGGDPYHDLWGDIYDRAVRRRAQGLPALTESQRLPTPEEIAAGQDRIRRLVAAWGRVPASTPAAALEAARLAEEEADPVLRAFHAELAAARAAAAPPPSPAGEAPAQLTLGGWSP